MQHSQQSSYASGHDFAAQRLSHGLVVSNDARKLLLAQLGTHDGVECLQGCVELYRQRLAAGQGQGEAAQRQDCVLKVLEDGV